MKTVYLDTNVYNAILDHPEKDLIIGKLRQASFAVIVSPWNVEEFAHEQNSKRRNALCSLALEVCNDQIFITSKKLMRKEVELAGNGQSIDIESMLKRVTIINNPLVLILEGSIIEQAPQRLFEQAKNEKRSFKQTMKKNKGLVVDKWRPYKDLPFEKFQKSALKNKEGKQMIADVMVDLVEHSLPDKAIEDLGLMPGLSNYIKYWWGLIYYHVIQDGKPKWGDNVDLHHSVYVGYSDIFVTNDRDFRDLAQIVAESAECLSLDDFFREYIYAS